MIMYYNVSLSDTYLSAMQFDRDQYKTELMWVKAVDRCPFVFDCY